LAVDNAAGIRSLRARFGFLGFVLGVFAAGTVHAERTAVYNLESGVVSFVLGHVLSLEEPQAATAAYPNLQRSSGYAQPYSPVGHWLWLELRV
jgi:hypothetical protein